MVFRFIFQCDACREEEGLQIFMPCAFKVWPMAFACHSALFLMSTSILLN